MSKAKYYTKMTTTQMIEFLQEYERGGATGRSREITFWVNSRPYHWIGLSSTGDGLVTDISISLKSDAQMEKMKS